MPKSLQPYNFLTHKINCSLGIGICLLESLGYSTYIDVSYVVEFQVSKISWILAQMIFLYFVTEDGRSMTSFYYCSVNHQSGLQSNTLSYIFLIHQNVPQIMSFHLRYMMVS